MNKKILAFAIASAALLGAKCSDAATWHIASGGKSTFSIVLPDDAPSSVQRSAQELQTDIKISTGATLPIRKESEKTDGPVISLGKTRLAANEKIDLASLKPEGFRILTRGENIYIIGQDTPDGTYTDQGGTSNGTANGVYSFLEKYLGVRWLMPGNLGTDIPRKSTFSVDDIDVIDAPFFINRREPYIQNNRAAVSKWEDHQKLGYSFRINHGHNWTQMATPDLFGEHPDWFAMIDGKRVPPTGRYKLETTNQGLVKFFAEKAVSALRANPQSNTFSLSPSDSRGWSESPESKALYDPPPAGSTYPSVTPLVLKFYREVSELVAKELPGGKLAGYIYADYLYPPRQGGMTLPDNFYPVIAPSIDYGYTLYRTDVQRDFSNLMEEWSKVTPHLFYYDLPNWLSGSSGMVTPAAPEILNYIFPRLAKNNVKGVYIYGTTAWSQGALANYLLAKMMWNPYLDAYQLQKEWLQRAYGNEAGNRMEAFYQQLDQDFRQYYQQNDRASYTVSNEMLKDLFGAHYPAWEKLFLSAKEAPMDTVQSQRLELIEDNLIVMQWRLRTAKILPADYNSPLTRHDEAVMEILFQENDDFELFPGMIDSGPAIKPVSVTVAAPLGERPKELYAELRGANQFLLFSNEGGEVTVTPTKLNQGKPFISYTLKDNKNKIVVSGVFNRGKTVTFPLPANTPHFLYVTSGIYRLKITGAAVAAKSNMDEGRLHLFGSPATLYAHVPANVKNWNFTLSSDVPGETAAVALTSPDGKAAANLATVTKPADRVTLPGQAGFWKIELKQADSGILDDIFLQFDGAVSPWISLDPSRPLIVQ